MGIRDTLVMAVAGHASVATTQTYVDNLESGKLDRQASEIAAGSLGAG